MGTCSCRCSIRGLPHLGHPMCRKNVASDIARSATRNTRARRTKTAIGLLFAGLVLHVHDAHGAHGHLLVGVHAHVAPHLDAVPAFGPARSVVGIAGLDAARHPIPERPGEIDGTAASRPLHRSLSAERPCSPFSYGLDSFTVQ